jgi:WD40 repeat protein
MRSPALDRGNLSCATRHNKRRQQYASLPTFCSFYRSNKDGTNIWSPYPNLGYSVRVLLSLCAFVHKSRTGDLLSSTALWKGHDRDDILKSGPVRCASTDKSQIYLATAGDDKILKVWELDGLKLLSRRYA